MRLLSNLLILVSIMAFWANAETPKDNKILPYPIYQHKLANGLNVVTVPFDSPNLVSLYIVVRAGSRDEIEEGVTGFAHFFEHMMFRGTDKYPKEKYSEVLKLTGASANANTSSDRTAYHMTGDVSRLQVMFELEADRFMNLHYSEHDFKTEAGAVKGEYTKNSASPYSQLFEDIQNTAFDKHTYKHTTMGFLKDIIDMPNQYQYSIKFFNRFYRPEYTTIIVVGDITPEKVNKMAEKFFGEWKHGDYVSVVPQEPVQKETRYVHVKNPNIPPMLALNYKSPAFSDKDIDMPALDVLSTILFSENSDLYKKLVINEQKVRSLNGGADNSRDPNLLTVMASLVNKGDLQYVKDEIIKKLQEVKKEGVSPKKLADTKSYLKYSYSMSIDNPSRIASSLAEYVALTGDPESVNKVYALYDKVTNKDIIRVANKYLVDTGLTIATISADEKGGVK